MLCNYFILYFTPCCLILEGVKDCYNQIKKIHICWNFNQRQKCKLCSKQTCDVWAACLLAWSVLQGWSCATFPIASRWPWWPSCSPSEPRRFFLPLLLRVTAGRFSRRWSPCLWSCCSPTGGESEDNEARFSSRQLLTQTWNNSIWTLFVVSSLWINLEFCECLLHQFVSTSSGNSSSNGNGTYFSQPWWGAPGGFPVFRPTQHFCHSQMWWHCCCFFVLFSLHQLCLGVSWVSSLAAGHVSDPSGQVEPEGIHHQEPGVSPVWGGHDWLAAVRYVGTHTHTCTHEFH